MNVIRLIQAAKEEVTFGLFEGVQIACDVIGKNPAVQAMTKFGKNVGANFKALTQDAAEIALGCLMGAGGLRGLVIETSAGAIHPDKVIGFHRTFGFEHR